MINRCVPDAELMPTAMALADELARGPASLGLTRQTIWAGLDSEWSDQLRREAQGQTKAGRTEDFREGVAAFLQKRPAQFKGK
jgi:2-(1,2-epoxy-1,2-dihydrophenyl)acetyl-CoA isomerase